MKIYTKFNQDSHDGLEQYRPSNDSQNWELVVSGFWSQTMYNSGHIAYYITKENDLWLLEGVERNAELDGITEEDVEAGNLNDDQIQAMWGITLEEAQNQEYREIVAVLEGAPKELNAKKAAEIMYEEVRKNQGKIIDEPDLEGLIKT